MGITTDPINHTFWVHTTQALYEVVPNDEDRDVWRARLEQGDFEGALKYAKVSPGSLSPSLALTLRRTPNKRISSSPDRPMHSSTLEGSCKRQRRMPSVHAVSSLSRFGLSTRMRKTG